MRLATFGGAFSTELGVVLGEEILPLNRVDGSLPRDMAVLIAQWERYRTRVDATLATDTPRLAFAGVPLRQPILRPGKILAIGKNYAAHARETGSDVPDRQIWFCKHATAANGPFDPVDIPRASTAVDYEAEL